MALAAQWQQESRAPNAQLVNVAVDVVAHASSPEEGIEGNAGGQGGKAGKALERMQVGQEGECKWGRGA